MRLTITAHLELYHLTTLFKLGQNVFIEFPEIKNCPGLNCNTNYSRFVFNGGVMFLKIVTQSDKTQKSATATSQSSTVPEVFWYLQFYYCSVFIIIISIFIFIKLNKFFIQ